MSSWHYNFERLQKKKKKKNINRAFLLFILCIENIVMKIKQILIFVQINNTKKKWKLKIYLFKGKRDRENGMPELAFFYDNIYVLDSNDFHLGFSMGILCGFLNTKQNIFNFSPALNETV